MILRLAKRENVQGRQEKVADRRTGQEGSDQAGRQSAEKRAYHGGEDKYNQKGLITRVKVEPQKQGGRNEGSRDGKSRPKREPSCF